MSILGARIGALSQDFSSPESRASSAEAVLFKSLDKNNNTTPAPAKG